MKKILALIVLGFVAIYSFYRFVVNFFMTIYSAVGNDKNG